MTYTAAAWHKARLDLLGFMVQHKDALPAYLVTEARSLYGTHDQCRKQESGESKAQYGTHLADTRPVLARHFCPPWHIYAPEYVATVYDFLSDCQRVLARRVAA